MKLKKQKRKLSARVEGWEKQRGSKVSEKDRQHEVSGFLMRKPGSNKK